MLKVFWQKFWNLPFLLRNAIGKNPKIQIGKTNKICFENWIHNDFSTEWILTVIEKFNLFGLCNFENGECLKTNKSYSDLNQKIELLYAIRFKSFEPKYSIVFTTNFQKNSFFLFRFDNSDLHDADFACL